MDLESDNPDISQIEECLKEIKHWMSLNFLKLNNDKTEVIEIGMYQNVVNSLSVAGFDIIPKEKGREKRILVATSAYDS